MKNTRYRDGNVVLFLRSDSERHQARCKLPTGKWKRFATGESNIKKASRIACDKYDELKVLSKRKIAFDTRRFSDVAKLAIREMETELDAGYGKKSFVDYISALENYYHSLFWQHQHR